MSILSEYLSKGNPTEPMVQIVSSLETISKVSPKLAKKVVDELKSQRSNIKMIASENYSSYAVQFAAGNLFTDKYSEGFPEHRFYAGCENVDAVESEACRLACELFGADHAYVQPHSGADANLCAYWAILYHRIIAPEAEAKGKPIQDFTREEWNELRDKCHKQKLLGLDYYSGGHLTHGYRQNVSAQMFDAYSYGVGADGLLDYDEIERLAMEIKPLILLTGYSAYPRKIDFSRMRDIADKCGATLMVDMAHFAGLVAGKVFTGIYNPVEWADVVTTTTHKTLRGPRGGMVLCKQSYAEAVDKGCPLVIGGPLPHIMLAKAIALKEASSDSFKEYAHHVADNARVLAEELTRLGYTVATGGTDNHLLLLDTTRIPTGHEGVYESLNGKQAEFILRECGITCNRNALPNDPNGPWYTSGCRIGTPAVTTLGMGEDEMKQIAMIIASVLENTEPSYTKSGKVSKNKVSIDPKVRDDVRAEVEALLDKFKLYKEIDLEFLKEHFNGEV